MWAMRLWDEGYKRISQEMQQQIVDDEGRLVRGGSGGLAESGQQGIDLRNLKRTIANLVAPLPVKVHTDSAALHAAGDRTTTSSSGSDTSGGPTPPVSPSTSAHQGAEWVPAPLHHSQQTPAGTVDWPGDETTDSQALPLHVPDSPREDDESTTISPGGTLTIIQPLSHAVYWSAPDLSTLRSLSAASAPEHPTTTEHSTTSTIASHQQDATQQQQLSSAPATPTTTTNTTTALLPVPGPGPLLTPSPHLTSHPQQLPQDSPTPAETNTISPLPLPLSPAARVHLPLPPTSSSSELDLEAAKVATPRADDDPPPLSEAESTAAGVAASPLGRRESGASPPFVPPPSPFPAFHPHHPHHLPAQPPRPHNHNYNQHGNPTPQPPPPPHHRHHHHHQQLPELPQQQPATGWGAPLACVPPAPQPQPQPPLAAAQPPSHALDPACLAACREIDLTADIAIGNLIGEGGFGKVYLAVYLGQQVAVKIQGDESGKASVLEEFKRELTTMSALSSHRNVLSLVGACTRPPRLAIVTEFCARGSIFGLLHNPECHLSWAQIIYMCLGAAHGMAHLHRCNVLHRDLKSANLLVDNDYTVKVADFGLSRLQSKAITAMTGGLGTYQWMAPEVLGNQRYSEKADVYSFGIVMWECTAREIPYAGMQGMQAAMAVMNRGLRPDIPAHTPPRLADLMRACWRPIPSQRPSMDDVAAALKAMYSDIRSGAPLT